MIAGIIELENGSYHPDHAPFRVFIIFMLGLDIAYRPTCVQNVWPL